MDNRYFLPSDLKERLQSLHPDALAMGIQSLCDFIKKTCGLSDGNVTTILEGLTKDYPPVKPPDQLTAAMEMIHQEEQRLLGDWEIDKANGLRRAREILNSALADYDSDPHWAAMSAFVNLNGLVHSRHRTPELIRARNAMREYYDRPSQGASQQPKHGQALTEVQKRVWNAIVLLRQELGWSPTYDEIAERVGLTKSTVHTHVQNLIEKGYVKAGDGPRTLRAVSRPG